jgi:hypothetical protein
MTKKKLLFVMAIWAVAIFLSACNRQSGAKENALTKNDSSMIAKTDEFAVVKLSTDIGKLTEKEKQMLPLLIEVAKIVDDLYWQQTLGDKKTFFDTIRDSLTRKFAEINYGPWERLNGNKPFIAGFSEKPAGANYYPTDMTKEEFEKWIDKNKTSLYTLVRRNDDKSLQCIWYHDAYKEQIDKAAGLLKQASSLAEDPGLKKYL